MEHKPFYISKYYLTPILFVLFLLLYFITLLVLDVILFKFLTLSSIVSCSISFILFLLLFIATLGLFALFTPRRLLLLSQCFGHWAF